MQRAATWSVALMLLVGGLAACGDTRYAVGATPEEAVGQHIRRQPPADDGFIPFKTLKLDDEAIVFYARPGDRIDQQLYYHIAYPDQDGWYTNECCDLGGGGLTGIEGLDNLLRTALSNSPEPRFVYGFAMEPEVDAIEVTFDDGQTVIAEIEDRFFFAGSETARNICDVRVFDEKRRVIKQVRISSAPEC